MRTANELDDIRSFFSALDCRVVPIIYKRNKEDWLASHTAQLDKMQYAGPYVDKLPVDQRVDQDWCYQINEIESFWSGVGSLIVVDYDDAVASVGSVIPSFANVINFNVGEVGEEYFLNARNHGEPVG